MNSYEREYIEECRAKVASQIAAYEELACVARKLAASGESELDAALEAFEPVFFNNMVLVLDTSFVHRSRTIEGKDGNPLNEARVLCTSLMSNDGVMVADKTIRLNPDSSVLGYQPGDEIRLEQSDFARLSEAFFNELESKFLERSAPAALKGR